MIAGLAVAAAVALARPAADTTAPAPWPAPLDRIVEAPRARTVGEALDSLAAAARVRFAFSPQVVPLARAVALPPGRAPLGALLRATLAGTGVVPVVAGSDQVVLAPGGSAAAADAAPPMARTTGRLARVVVTGTPAGGPERASPWALSVVEADAVPGGAHSLAALLDATIPGVWLWRQPPTSALARWGSIRGASSFGVSVPKVYVDGIEVANPLLLTQLDGARVQRVEVIRGPQGAALYGADAISGVVNIVTRQDGATGGGLRTELRASAGSAATSYAPGAALAQEHGVTLRSGSAAASAGLDAGVSTLGAFVDGASALRVSAGAGGRHIGARTVTTVTARLDAADNDVPASPLLDTVPGADAWAGAQRVRQYTLGATTMVSASDRWTHTLVAGIDGYRLAGVAGDGIPILSAADSALRAARGGADRLTLRASGTRRAGAAASLTLGAEHSTARETTNGEGTRLTTRDRPAGDLAPSLRRGDATTWWSNTGALAQGQLAVRGQLYLHAGARVEHMSGLASGAQVALLPMAGAAWVRDAGSASLKLRGAYGRGIRPARTVQRGATWMGQGVRGALASLAPERQGGTEIGADLLWDAPWGARASVAVTRFDQRASGLVQAVAVLDSALATGGPGPGPRPRPDGRRPLAFVLQNVGAIDNRGWELQGSVARGALTLGGVLALVDSRVDRLAAGYRGDLYAGARMLEVPARTLGASATWSAPRWSASLLASRAADWRNYDRVGLASAYAAAQADTTLRPPLGPALRQYWRAYDGRTRLGARLDVTVWRASALSLRGDNLLGWQTGEPDNATVLPGRTVTVGMRTAF